jgi:hypothetical protein
MVDVMFSRCLQRNDATTLTILRHQTQYDTFRSYDTNTRRDFCIVLWPAAIYPSFLYYHFLCSLQQLYPQQERTYIL